MLCSTSRTTTPKNSHTYRRACGTCCSPISTPANSASRPARASTPTLLGAGVTPRRIEQRQLLLSTKRQLPIFLGSGTHQKYRQLALGAEQQLTLFNAPWRY